MAKQSSKKKASTPLLLATACGVIIILALSAFNLALHSAKSTNNVLGLRVEASTRRTFLQDKAFWEEFLEKNPTYIDGWLELTKVAYILEDYDYAKGALNSARSIDPNSDKVDSLAKELGLFRP